MSVLRMFVLIVALVMLAACGGAEDQAASSDGVTSEPTSDDMDMDDEAMEGAEEEHFAFGHPGDPSDADRTINITTGNELVFDPAEVTVAPDETVTFSITNEGDLPHDFVIGDEAAQEEHEEEMEQMEETGSEMAMEEHEHGESNAISTPPGETHELTWVFDGETEGLLYGCHEPGHYEAGMIGHITVEG